jgi:HAE1 family hydrophobic/amphiphilic exporter-1
MFGGIKRRYITMLNWALDHKGKTILIVVALLVLSLIIPISGIIGTEFMPGQDIPIMALNVKAPVGTSLDETDSMIRQIEDVFMQVEGVQFVMSLVGPMTDASAQADPTNPQEVNEAQVFARLYQQKDRTNSYEEIQSKVRELLPNIEGSEINFLSREQMMGEGQSNPIEIKIFGKDLEVLKEFAGRIEEKIKVVKHVSDVVNSVKVGKPEAHIIINKDKAFKYGLTTYQIASAIKTASIGTRAGIFREAGEEIDILVRLDEETRNSFEDIMHIAIISPMGFSIPLNQIAHIEYAEGPRVISHEKQNRKVTVSANITGTQDMGGVVDDVQAQISDIVADLPPGYFLNIGGAYEDMNEAFKTLSLALLLAVVLVYIVMASQFESLRQPFIVMFTIPLAVIGVMFILGITGTTLSVVSFVGGIILSGIVVNNGIVLIDHMNQLRLKGMEKRDAIIQAGKDRLRPVLITAITTMMGMLPMALSTGEGSELKAPMALTVIGGLISATFLTLILLPVIYSIIAKKKVGIVE